ncbi:MAG: putative porin [Chitinophagaceae bacterium]|nr:putative porin [Chitinophagaceae bacterium]
MIRSLIIIFILCISTALMAQRPGGLGNRNLLQNMPGGFSRGGGGGNSGPFKDSLLHRTGLEDSATIAYRYLDTSRFYFLDSSVNDFSRKWHIPWYHIFLGNTGSASRSLLFSPNMKPGWDAGMHAYDAYIQRVEETKFYNTTRPYTQLNYILGPKQEQTVTMFHTQNIRYNWNFSFRYNLINSPGLFRNQRNNHNNYLLNSWYIAPKRRYTAFFVLSANSIGATENGGIVSNRFLDSLPAFGNRFNIPANLGGTAFEGQTFLSNTINTGNKYKITNWLIRQYYDFGKKDSVVTDSNVVYLFYPRFRFQHTLQFNKYSYEFADVRVDAAGYKKLYGITDLPASFGIKDFWRMLDNEMALYSFPDIKNQQQFLKAAVGFQNISGDFGVRTQSYNTLYVKGEYRNKTKNKKWDMELAGTFFTAGTYAGDYNALALLKREIGSKLGALTLSFMNVNRTPSFVHDDLSNFKKFNIGNTSFKKENTIVLSALYELPKQKLTVGAKYYLAGNYIFFKNYTQAAQEATLFNVLMLQATKQFKLTKRWNLYSEIFVQQATPNSPVNLPLLLTRNRFAYEGRFFKNLNLSTGIEIRYYTPIKMDGYSPILGQFFLQNDTTIRNRPDVTAYLHFRIRSMYIFVRAENLNAIQANPFGFYSNNMATPVQPIPGMLIRFGLNWGFVN